MMRRRSLIFAALLTAAAFALPATAAAQLEPSVPLDSFFGTWHGMGVEETDDALFFSMGRRDLDIEIVGEDDGFAITWTTLRRTGDDPDSPEFERTTTYMEFYPGDTQHLFEGYDSGNPLEGEIMGWARLHGATLSIYRMAVDEDGGYWLGSWDRTLNEQDRMELRYTLLNDGQPVRNVIGQLERVE
ncbi:MAG: hypothetical protein RLO50_21610 [Azospirillaceae bacterium]